ncbi:MAG: GGDEF domain-containing protein [Desulfonatronovibrionaceae bacterium]
MSADNIKHGLSMQELQDLLTRIGLEDDPDWIAVILFVRNVIIRLSCLTEKDKSILQREIFSILEDAAPPRERLARAYKTIEDYLTSEMDRQLKRTKDDLAREQKISSDLLSQLHSILKDLKGSVERQTQRMESFGETTIADIQAKKDPQEIVSSIRSSIQEMIQEAKGEAKIWEQRARMLERTAMFDHLLTNIFNRGVFDSYLKKTTALHREKELPLSLLMIDVDDFKAINDKWGHQVGDDVLQALSKVIRSQAELHKGVVCRYGGEELSVIFENTPEEKAVEQAETLRLLTQEYNFIPRKKTGEVDSPIHFTISIGTASMHGEDWEASDLIGAADRALYQAKSQGKNQVVAYSDVACALPRRKKG